MVVNWSPHISRITNRQITCALSRSASSKALFPFFCIELPCGPSSAVKWPLLFRALAGNGLFCSVANPGPGEPWGLLGLFLPETNLTATNLEPGNWVRRVPLID